MNHRTASLPDNAAAPVAFRAIEAEGRVSLLHAACLALRSGTRACTACLTACPNESIQLDQDSLSVSSACLGCGHCAAVCPTGALTVKGFGSQTLLPDGNVVRVECWKVPASIAGHQALRVPCLGGLSPARWLIIAEAAEPRQVVVVDRGWCTECSAASHCRPAHPVSHALDQASAILAAIGWSESRRPGRQLDPLPPRLMPAEIPAERPVSLARRAFFRRVGNEAQKALGENEPAADTSPRILRRSDMILPERGRLLSTVRRLAAAAGKTMPALPYIQLSISRDCNHHQLCARLCPTGALAIHEGDGRSGLTFDTAACTACGLCAGSCPERAIRLLPAHVAPVADAPEILTTFSERLCARCRTPFSGSPSASECPGCRLSKKLGSAFFGGGTPVADNRVSVASTELLSGGVHHE